VRIEFFAGLNPSFHKKGKGKREKGKGKKEGVVGGTTFPY